LLKVTWNGAEVAVKAPEGIVVELAPECPEDVILK
jgi:hypothetical protein